MNANVLIRAIGEDERDAWDPLWAGYLTFYKIDAGAGDQRYRLGAVSRSR